MLRLGQRGVLQAKIGTAASITALLLTTAGGGSAVAGAWVVRPALLSRAQAQHPPRRIPATVRVGARITISDHVRSSSVEQIALQERSAGHWRTLTRAMIRPRRHGRYLLTWRAPEQPGLLAVRLILLRHRMVAHVLESRTVMITSVSTGGPSTIVNVPLSANSGSSGSEQAEPMMTAEPDGTTLLTWSSHVITGDAVHGYAAHGSVWMAQLLPGASRWGSPTPLFSSATENPNQPSITAGPDGTAVALWTARDSRYGSLWIAVRAPGVRSFPPPTKLVNGDANHDVGSAEVAVDGSGQLSVIWYNGTESASQPMLQAFTPGTGWSPPTPFGADSISLVQTSSAESVVVSGFGGNYDAISHPRGGAWGAPQTFWQLDQLPGWGPGEQEGTSPIYSPGAPQATPSGVGTIGAAWSIETGATGTVPTANRLIAITRDAGGQWGIADTLDTTANPNFAFDFRMTADAVGDVTVLARQDNGTSAPNLIAYTSDAAGSSWASSVVQRSFPTNDAFRVMSADIGRTAVIFENASTNGSTARLFITRRDTVAGGWSTPELLSGAASVFAPEGGISTLGLPFRTGGPALFVAANGILATWQEADGQLRSAHVPW
jgi:hypothetical protein